MQINLIRLYFFGFLFLVSSCSGGDPRDYSPLNEIIPEYESKIVTEFISPAKKDTVSYPLDVSNYSFYQLQESVNNSLYPSSINSEELINSFSYNYPNQNKQKQMGIYTEAAISPWDTERKLIHIGVFSTQEENKESKAKNNKSLIFAIDTSGSMSGKDRIELAKKAMSNIIIGLSVEDNVAIVQYTTKASIVLPPTSLKYRRKILASIQSLKANGGTDAWPGILLSYKLAEEMNNKNQETKLFIFSDGDFGGVNNQEFISLVEDKNKTNINLSILGFGIGNKKVETMNLLLSSKKGEAFYIDSVSEANSYLSNKYFYSNKNQASNLEMEVKFNEKLVKSFRFIGFENHISNKKDSKFSTPTSYSLTALYEIITDKQAPRNQNLLKVSLKYTTAKGKKEEINSIVPDTLSSTWQASENFRFAAGVAGLGMLINNSSFKGNLDYYMVIHLLQSSLNFDPEGERARLLNTVLKLKKL